MKVGEINKLKILRGTSVGMYLGDDEDNDVLLPHKYIPENAVIGEDIEVFIYRDSEDRLIATNLKPSIELNGFAVLQVVAESQFGAFLDWGLEKDLFVPFREQNHKLKKGQYIAAYLYLDTQTDRLVASAKVNKYFKNLEGVNLEVGQEVDLLFFEKTDLGYNVVINNTYKGLVYENDIFQRVAWGDTSKGYIKLLREDGKIDVSLRSLDIKQKFDKDCEHILSKLKASPEHKLELNDKSDAIMIMERLEMSKKAFKKAVGILFKARKISIAEDGIIINVVE